MTRAWAWWALRGVGLLAIGGALGAALTAAGRRRRDG